MSWSVIESRNDSRRQPSNWSETSTPAAATAASASHAAGSGTVCHVCTGIFVNISAVAAQGDISFVLRDGATGAGTVLWTGRLAAATGAAAYIAITGLNLIGSAATAMTLESSAAPAATNFASVTITGYSVDK